MAKTCERLERTCQTCGKIFFIYPSLAKRGFGKFCSRGCWNKWLLTNPMSDETRKKISCANRGLVFSNEHRNKMRIAWDMRRGKNAPPTRKASVCRTLEHHSKILKDDPERLSTDFLKKIINPGIDCGE